MRTTGLGPDGPGTPAAVRGKYPVLQSPGLAPVDPAAVLLPTLFRHEFLQISHLTTGFKTMIHGGDVHRIPGGV